MLTSPATRLVMWWLDRIRSARLARWPRRCSWCWEPGADRIVAGHPVHLNTRPYCQRQAGDAIPAGRRPPPP